MATLGNVVAIGEAMEVAGLDPVPLSKLEAFADELERRFPALVDSRQAKGRAHWQRWTPEDEARLRELYESDAKMFDICQELGRTRGAINGAISRLGLNRGAA